MTRNEKIRNEVTNKLARYGKFIDELIPSDILATRSMHALFDEMREWESAAMLIIQTDGKARGIFAPTEPRDITIEERLAESRSWDMINLMAR